MIQRNMIHPQLGEWAFNIPRTSYDYAKEVGTGLGSNVIMAPVQWIMRTFPEAPVMMHKKNNKGEKERVYEHPILELLNKPNPFYTGEILWMATLLSWTIAGNAYWLKVRNAQGKVVELWYAPHWMVAPKGHTTDKTIYIDHYIYNPAGMPIVIPAEDVVHSRFGINPERVREGLSPLNSVIREVFTDDEASNFSASLLRNSGVPGVVISPENEGANITPEDVKEVKEKFRQAFTGDRAGGALVMSGPTKVTQFGFNPQQLKLGDIRDISEERVCAVLGIPAAVVGFGSGLQQTKVGATMNELIALAWSGCLIPTQRILSSVLHDKLLSDFEPDINKFEIGFDNSEVWALQEDRAGLFTRLNIGVTGGWIKVSEAREKTGFGVEESDKVYLRPLAVIETTGEEKGRWTGDGGLKTALEERLAATSTPGKPTRAQARLAREFDIDLQKFIKRFRRDVLKELEAIGEEIETIALGVLEAKSAEDDARDAEMIISKIDFASREAFLKNVYKNNYTRIMKATAERINTTLELGISIPEPREAELIASAMQRVKLLDMKKSAAKRTFREIAAGREQGESVAQIARRLREFVPAGQWSSPKVRAQIIARTEVTHAQNMAAAESYREGGVTHVLILDARGGATDDECMDLNNTVHTLQDGEALVDDEHPNGTRRMIAMPPEI